MDIPFFRFALPIAILYFYWNILVANPWIEEAADTNPNALSVTKSQELLATSKKLVQAGQLREALAPSLQLYKAFPENYIYIQELARIYDSLGQYADSAPMWDRFLQYSPTPIDGCPMAGFAYENMGEPDEAFKAHERCWKFEPTNSDLIFFYARALERKGEYKRAAELYEQGMKRASDYPDLRIGLARAQLQTGQFAPARKNLALVLESRPDNTDALVASGLLYARLGLVKAAVQELEHAHRMSPGYKEAEVLLGQLRMR